MGIVFPKTTILRFKPYRAGTNSQLFLANFWRGVVFSLITILAHNSIWYKVTDY